MRQHFYEAVEWPVSEAEALVSPLAGLRRSSFVVSGTPPETDAFHGALHSHCSRHPFHIFDLTGARKALSIVSSFQQLLLDIWIKLELNAGDAPQPPSQSEEEARGTSIFQCLRCDSTRKAIVDLSIFLPASTLFCIVFRCLSLTNLAKAADEK